MRRIVFLVAFAVFNHYAFPQDQPDLIDDSTSIKAEENAELFQEVSNLNPQRAALLSAVLPGLGQVYNKQYWKVPLVISGLLVFAHYINYNNKVYHAFRNAAIIENAGGDNPYAELVSTSDGLVRNRDTFRQNRDFLIVLGSAFYLLQIVDAHVSAHLNEFIVNKDLAFGIEPSIESTPLFSQVVGVSFTLRF
ncbi:MAG: DUF5683 domain-containing protein [Bacteroidota bacterium]